MLALTGMRPGRGGCVGIDGGQGGYLPCPFFQRVMSPNRHFSFVEIIAEIIAVPNRSEVLS